MALFFEGKHDKHGQHLTKIIAGRRWPFFLEVKMTKNGQNLTKIIAGRRWPYVLEVEMIKTVNILPTSFQKGLARDQLSQ